MARDLLYPPSVTPGIPKLGQKPNGWIETTFGDVLCVVKRPAEIHDNEQYRLVTAKRNRGGVVPREVLKGKQILTKTQFYVEAGDFLISKRQIVHGACGVVPPELEGAVVSGEYSVLKPKDGIFLDYLNYYTHTVHFQQTCFQSSVGVAVEKMIFDLREWLKYKIYLPSLPEQHEIAEVLGAWDNAIALTEQLIAAKQQLKKGLMQVLLTGKKRFAEFAKSSHAQSTKYGLLPTDWELVKVCHIANVDTESLNSGAGSRNSYYYIELSAVNEGNIELPTDKTPFQKLPSRARRIPHKGDVIMSTVRPNLLGYAVCDFDPQEYLFSTGFALITPKLASDTEFIYQSLYGSVVQKQLHALVTGSNYPAINSTDVKNLDFSWTRDPNERQKIGQTLKSIDTEIRLLHQKLTALQQQKKGLMQQLLAGRKRVR